MLGELDATSHAQPAPMHYCEPRSVTPSVIDKPAHTGRQLGAPRLRHSMGAQPHSFGIVQDAGGMSCRVKKLVWSLRIACLSFDIMQYCFNR